MLLDIIKYPNDLLHEKCPAVPPTDVLNPEIQELIDNMIETMKSANGIGIAAPQVGVLKRIMIVDVPGVGPQAFINPKIVSRSIQRMESEEGCLSIPGTYGIVKRHKKVKVRALNRKGETVKVNADQVASVIFQHEIDHLDGVLFIDPERLVRYTSHPKM